MARYIIEGTWRGYRSSQDHVCHREIYKSNRIDGGDFIKTLRGMHSIPFSDGTALIVSVREAKPREKVQEKHGYTQFIKDAVYAEWDRKAEKETSAQ